MPKIPSLTGKVANKKPTAPQKVAEPVTWHRVLEDRQVPRAGGTYMLRAGKELPSSSYNIKELQRAGVKLELMSEIPQWYQDAQLASMQKYEELVEAGIAENAGLGEPVDPTAPQSSAQV